MAIIAGNIACPACGYNLRGLGDRQRCPECGHAYDVTPGPSVVPAVALPRLNLFDKFCAILAVALAVLFLPLGVVGLITGSSANFTLPPVIGVVPALVGWGIVRSVYVAWKCDRASRQPPRRRPQRPIPSIYRDPIPTGPAEALDREIAFAFDDEPPEPTPEGFAR